MWKKFAAKTFNMVHGRSLLWLCLNQSTQKFVLHIYPLFSLYMSSFIPVAFEKWKLFAAQTCNMLYGR